MRVAQFLLTAVLACGFAEAGASEPTPGATETPSASAAAPAAGVAAPSAAATYDIPLDVILEYMPELAPSDSETVLTAPLVAPPSIDLWQRIRAASACRIWTQNSPTSAHAGTPNRSTTSRA